MELLLKKKYVNEVNEVREAKTVENIKYEPILSQLVL